MLVYFLILSYLGVLSIFEVGMKREMKEYFYILSFIILFLFSGTRYFPLQQDYSTYLSFLITQSSKGIGLDGYFEPGYLLLTTILANIFKNPYICLSTISFIGVGLVFLSIKRLKSIYLFLPLALYFSHGFIMREMGAIRAGLAAGICLYSYIYIQQKKILPWLMCVFLATSFHLSAGIYFLMYPICSFNWNKRLLYSFLLLCLLMGFVYPLGKLLINLPGFISISRLSGYAEDIYGGLGIFSNPNTLKQIVIVLIGIKYYNFLIGKVPYYRTILLGSYISVCWLICWNDFPIVAGRFSMFFSLAEIILLPSFLMVLNKRSRLIGMLLILSLAFMQLYLNNIKYLTPESGYYPYKSIIFI